MGRYSELWLCYNYYILVNIKILDQIFATMRIVNYHKFANKISAQLSQILLKLTILGFNTNKLNPNLKKTYEGHLLNLKMHINGNNDFPLF